MDRPSKVERMEIQKTPQTYTFPLTNIVRARNAQGSISVPVRPSQYLYSQLKHIKGFPASGGHQGYPLNKLRTLDNLIERLQGLKGAETYKISEKEEGSSLDAKIRFYQQELKRSIDSRIPEFLGNPSRDQGIALNILV